MTDNLVESQNIPTPEPLACPKCGVITVPHVSPGSGPHAFRANCPDCGRFLRWLSKYTPEERAAHRAEALHALMARLAPTGPQLQLLQALGDRGPAPANRLEASQRIDHLKRERRVS